MLLSVLQPIFELTDFYNSNLKTSFKQYLIAPPKFDPELKVYCLDYFTDQDHQDYFPLWVFDWIFYFAIRNAANKALEINLSNLSPDGPIVKAIILIYCAIVNKTETTLKLNDNAFVSKWQNSLSTLLIRNNPNFIISNMIEELYKSFSDFEVPVFANEANGSRRTKTFSKNQNITKIVKFEPKICNFISELYKICTESSNNL